MGAKKDSNSGGVRWVEHALTTEWVVFSGSKITELQVQVMEGAVMFTHFIPPTDGTTCAQLVNDRVVSITGRCCLRARDGAALVAIRDGVSGWDAGHGLIGNGNV